MSIHDGRKVEDVKYNIGLGEPMYHSEKWKNNFTPQMVTARSAHFWRTAPFRDSRYKFAITLIHRNRMGLKDTAPTVAEM
jgi:hypothetical protein